MLSINPFQIGMKNIFLQLLEGNYTLHENIINNISDSISSEQKYKEVGQLLLCIYEAGYKKSVQQHQESLSKLGLKANIVKPPDPPKPILGQKNQADSPKG